jgi:uncharacterized repeat protein (TIGR01451 family)
MSQENIKFDGRSGYRTRRQRIIILRLALNLCALFTVAASPSWAITTSALKDQTCVGYRTGNTTCTAGEFTVSPVFSAEPGTPPFCIAGAEFNFKVQVGLSGTNTDRQDIGFFVGQQGNDPRDTTPGNICSVATFPRTPYPWKNNDGDACGDFAGRGNATTTIDEIKVVCQGDNSGALQIPYVLTYAQNSGSVCSGPANVTNGAPSKCNAGVSSVSGTVAVFSGAYVDVTKRTAPGGDRQNFSFTATGPAGSKVIVLTGATLSANSARGGSYTPATIAAATNRVTFTLEDNETARVYINALPTDQTLTITEGFAEGDWDSSAAISCSPVVGAPALTTDPATRTIAAALNSSNAAAACTVTNMKRARVFLLKNVAGRTNPSDQFTVSATGGGTLAGTTSATTSGTSSFAFAGFSCTPGAPLTLTDAKAAGPTPISGYAARLSCINLFSGPGATPAASLPNRLMTTSYSLAPAPGDTLVCTYTNTPRATLAKAYSATDIALGGSSTLTFTIVNPSSAPEQSDLGFTDTFPAGLAVTGVTPLIGNGCSGSPSFTSSTVTLGGGSMDSGSGSCSFTAKVRGDAAGSYLNDGSKFSAQGGGIDTERASATLNVFAPPTVGKLFGAPSVPAGSPVSLTLSLANPSTNVAPITGVTVRDLFPAGLVLRNTNFSFTPAACGTLSRPSGAALAAGDGEVLFSAASLLPGASCEVSMSVSSSSAGDITNSTSAPAATGPVALTGSGSQAALKVYPLPLISIMKTADRAGVDPGQELAYSIELVNTGAGAGSNIVLTDDLSPYAYLFLGAGSPFTFTDSSPASGVALGTPQYSSNNGSSWVYSPVSGGGGAPAGYDGAVTNWRIPMNGSIRPGGSFRLEYKVKVK